MTREEADRKFWAGVRQRIHKDREDAKRDPQRAREILISAGILLENGEPAPRYRVRKDG